MRDGGGVCGRMWMHSTRRKYNKAHARKNTRTSDEQQAKHNHIRIVENDYCCCCGCCASWPAPDASLGKAAAAVGSKPVGNRQCCQRTTDDRRCLANMVTSLLGWRAACMTGRRSSLIRESARLCCCCCCCNRGDNGILPRWWRHGRRELISQWFSTSAIRWRRRDKT